MNRGDLSVNAEGDVLMVCDAPDIFFCEKSIMSAKGDVLMVCDAPDIFFCEKSIMSPHRPLKDWGKRVNRST